jgi:hypothetical protein
MLGMVALGIDVGYITLVRSQLQVAADSAALAAAGNLGHSRFAAVGAAQWYAGQIRAADKTVDLGWGDVEFGAWDCQTRTFTPTFWLGNAVRLTARRDETVGGKLPLFFARAFGVRNCALQATAVAMGEHNFCGFRLPSPEEKMPVLPMAIDMETCCALLARTGSDEWSWDPTTGSVAPGADGVREVSLYPGDAGSPGNFGTLRLGDGTSGPADLSRQIREGLGSQDLTAYGGKLELGPGGLLDVSGDAVVSSAIAADLEAVRGKPRIVLVYDSVTRSGENASYRIVRFIGICIVDVKLTGDVYDKRVVIQPARVLARAGIPAGGPESRSHFVLGPIQLVK